MCCHCAQHHFRRRLPDHHISAHECEHCIPTPHCHRKIKSGNHSHNPERMPLLIHAVVRSLAVHAQSVQLPRLTDCEITDVNHLLHFAHSLLQTFSHLVTHEHTEL